MRKSDLIIFPSILIAISLSSYSYAEEPDILDSIPLSRGELSALTSDDAALSGETGDISFFAGYRFVSGGYSSYDLFPYSHTDDTPIFSSKGTIIKRGLIVDLDAEHNSLSDYFVSVTADSYAKYRIKITADSLNHNLKPYSNLWSAFDPFGTGMTFVQSNTGDAADLKVTVKNEKAELNLKPFQYPMHFNFSARKYSKNGVSQENYADVAYLSGSSTIFSSNRLIDRETDSWSAGFDAHAGYFDLVLNIEYMSFKDNLPIPYDAYISRSSAVNPVEILKAGSYQHNEAPDSRFWMSTSRLHTSISGGLNAALSLSFGERESDSKVSDFKSASAVESKVANIAADLTYTPSPLVTAAFKYRRESVDTTLPRFLERVNNPLGAIALDTVYTPAPVDYVRENLIASIVLRNGGLFSIKTEYRGDYITRDIASGFSAPSWLEAYPASLSASHREERHKGIISFNLRPSKPFKIKGELSAGGTVHSLYPTTPDMSYSANIQTVYRSLKGNTLTVDLKGTTEKADSKGKAYLDGFRRKTGSAVVSGSVFPTERLSINASTSFSASRTERSAGVYSGAEPQVSFGSDFSSITRVYSLNSQYQLSSTASISAGYTRSEGVFTLSPDQVFMTLFSMPADTSSFGSLANVDRTDDEVTLRLDVNSNEHLSWDLAYSYLKNSGSSSYESGGDAHLVTAMIGIRW